MLQNHIIPSNLYTSNYTNTSAVKCNEVHTQFCVDVMLYVANTPVSLSVLIDSGLAGNFISASLISNQSIPMVESSPSLVRALDKHLVCNAPITHHIESRHAHTHVQIPQVYNKLAVVFSGTNATRLPLYRPWELLSGTTPPRAHVYPFSLVETRGMEEYVAESLKEGLISRSTSPASAVGFFHREER